MNGLELIDEKDPSVMDKILRQEPKENAYVEINNIIASTPLEQLDRSDIERVLISYDISSQRAAPRLLQIYSRVLAHFIRDFEISEQEASTLVHLQNVLVLNGADVGQVHATLIYPIFQNAVKNAIFDGRLTAEEERWLNIVAQKLRIPDNYIAQLYATVVKPFMESRLAAMLTDDKFSPDEEREFFETGKNLKATINLPEPIRAILKRSRFLWELQEAPLPRLEVPVYLNKNEFCAAYVIASVRELREVTNTTAEYSERVNLIKDLWNREVTSGKIETRNRIEEIMKEIDSGRLYFTNHRLLFNGSKGNFEDRLSDIVGASFSPSGLRLERSNGLDRVFIFDTDKVALQIIFERLVANSQR